MTARAEYTAEEWVLLLTVPQAVVGAVAFADGAGFMETVGEAVLASIEQARGKERHPGNELIAALLAGGERVDPALLPQPQRIGEPGVDVARRLRSLAIDQCRAAAALLADRSNPEEAAGYAAWVMAVAKTAATATRHKDGLFRPKGPTVDAQERAILGEIGEALGVDVGELPADSVSSGPSDAPPTDAYGSGPADGIPAPDTIRPLRNGKGPDMPSGPIDPS